MGIVGFFLILVAIPVFLFKRSLHFKKNSAHSIDKVLKQAETYIKSGRASRVFPLLRPFEPKGVGGVKMFLHYAQALRLSGREDEALSKAEYALELFPKDLLMRKELGRIYMLKGLHTKAKETFLEALSVLQGEEEFLEFASACFQSGDVSMAWRYLFPFLKLTSNGRLVSLAADCLFIQKEFSKAIPLYKKAVSLGWVNHKLMNRLGHSFRLTRKLDEAEEAFHRLLLEDRQDVVAALGLGLCFESRGLHAKALILYQQEEIWSLNDERLIKRSGICAYRIGKYEAAKAYLESSIGNEKNNVTLLGYLAISLVHLGNWSEAEDRFQNIAKDFPESYIGYRGLAWLYGTGNSSLSQEQAIKYAVKAMKIRNDRAALEILSACYARTGDFEQAHRILETLSTELETKEMRVRRLKAMRTLRRQQPLESDLVAC